MFRNISIGYLTMGSALFCVWFGLFIMDRTTPKNHGISWIILLIAPLFWPIVLPLSIRELLLKARNKKTVRDSIHRTEGVLNIQTNELNTN